MFYLAGSLLFAVALMSALAVTFIMFAQYRAQMLAALRTLSLDGIHGAQRSPVASAPSGLAIRARQDRPGRPAPYLAA